MHQQCKGKEAPHAPHMRAHEQVWRCLSWLQCSVVCFYNANSCVMCIDLLTPNNSCMPRKSLIGASSEVHNQASAQDQGQGEEIEDVDPESGEH